MRASAKEGFSGRDRLTLVDLPIPESGPDDVLVRVRAARVGPWDAKTREVLPPPRKRTKTNGCEIDQGKIWSQHSYRVAEKFSALGEAMRIRVVSEVRAGLCQ
jgi:NADPH:quinone reductase-like Zn-dependent oxidoreductase